jgi:hypothetical protein
LGVEEQVLVPVMVPVLVPEKYHQEGREDLCLVWVEQM